MAADLGTAGAEVHEAAAVLRFWFEELNEEQHWARDAAMDMEIARRFGPLRERILAKRAAGWRGRPHTLLAAVIVLDQFSRNIFRDHAEAFAGDNLALDLTLYALGQSWDVMLPPHLRVFLYMPLQHSENPRMQQLSLRLFKGSDDPEQLRYARAHAEVIATFGRFPGRNAALGRPSTAEEQAYLSRPDAGF